MNRSSKSGTCKGCAFIVFEKQSVAESLIVDPRLHDIGGKLVEVKSCHQKGMKAKTAKPSCKSQTTANKGTGLQSAG